MTTIMTKLTHFNDSNQPHSLTALPTILVVGSLNVDLTTFTPRIPNGGETYTATSFSIGSGGKGANQAVACSRLSRPKVPANAGFGTVNVSMMGAVGDDAFGKTMLSDLEKSGVNTDCVAVRDGLKTGVAVVIVEETTRQNRILLSPEANDALLPKHIQQFPTPAPALIILQFEIRLETVLEVMDLASQLRIPVLLNPAPAIKMPTAAYAWVEHLILNETEASILSGCCVDESTTEGDISLVAKQFNNLGVKNVVITLGGRGVYYSCSNGESNHESGLLKSLEVSVVDTTAAGDTFIGAYAVEAVKPGFHLGRVCEKANRAAALTVGRKGAQESIPWADELTPYKSIFD